MRGCFSLLTREADVNRYRTGIFVASAEPDVISKVLVELERKFPQLTFTYLAPFMYRDLLMGRGEAVWIDDVKAHPARSLRELRERKFDVAFLVLAGRPTFRKAKLAGFLLNPRRLVICTEDGSSFLADRAHWKAMLRHIRARWKRYPAGAVLFVPFGFLYLAGRTLWLRRRWRHHPANEH